MAAVVHLVARAFGGRGRFLAARAALFWSGLAVAPLALADRRSWARWRVSLHRAASCRGSTGSATRPSALWVWIFAASLAEAEGFAATGRVAAVVAAVLAGIAGLAEYAAAAWRSD